MPHHITEQAAELDDPRPTAPVAANDDFMGTPPPGWKPNTKAQTAWHAQVVTRMHDGMAEIIGVSLALEQDENYEAGEKQP